MKRRLTISLTIALVLAMILAAVALADSISGDADTLALAMPHANSLTVTQNGGTTASYPFSAVINNTGNSSNDVFPGSVIVTITKGGAWLSGGTSGPWTFTDYADPQGGTIQITVPCGSLGTAETMTVVLQAGTSSNGKSLNPSQVSLSYNITAGPDDPSCAPVVQNQTITVMTPAPASAVYNTSFTVAATASSGLPVAYSASGSCTNAGATFTMTSGFGTCTVHYNQAGNASYNPAPEVISNTAAQKADAIISITPYSVTYDGNAHTATGTAIGVESPTPADLSSLLDLSDTTHTDAGIYDDDLWSFAGNNNYNSANGMIDDSIAQALVTATAGSGSTTYDAATHSPSACVVSGAYKGDLTCANNPTSVGPNAGTTTIAPVVSGTGLTNFDIKLVNGSYTIARANAVCTISPYNVTYDGGPHSATGSCKGVEDETLDGLDLSGTTHTDAGFYEDDPWTFTDVTGNYYDDTGVVDDNIDKADATCNIEGYTGTYDGDAHGASGHCTGVGGVNLDAGLDLGATFTDYSGGTAHWTFAGGTNYNDQSGNVNIVINKADATCSISGWSGTYDGNPHGASGLCTGVKDETLDGLDLGNSFTNVPGGTANWTFTDKTGNYNDDTGSVTITINKRFATWTTDPSSKTYGDADPSSLTTGSGSNFVDEVTAIYSRVAGETVAGNPYHITATLSAAAGVLDNYNITNNGADFTITKRDAVWATDPNSKTYGDADPNPLTTGNGVNFVAADGVSATYSRVAGETVAGNPYHITATLTAEAGVLDNYNITNAGANFTINPKAASVTPNPASKYFSFPDPSPLTTGTLTGFLSADGVTATYSRTAGEAVGHYAISATLSPIEVLGNYSITYNTADFEIKGWTLNGFFQPVDMGNVWNTVKKGSTVPLKFRIFAGPTELTDVLVVKSYTYQQVTCSALGTASEDPITTLAATGGTVLRYSDGQFIFNWKTPSVLGCYRVTITALDGSTLVAYFKTK